MEKRLSIAELKAKTNATVLQNAEIYMGGEESLCHNGEGKPAPMPQDGVIVVRPRQ
jgi:hypothetical protein